MRLLLVEDEYKLAESLKKALETQSYAVDLSFDGQNGYQKVCDNEYDLIILDLGLPLMDGTAVAKKIREDGVSTPILMLTARDTVANKIEGLDSGADDYLVKPFDFEELLARIRALLRRQTTDQPTLVYKLGSLSLDPKSHLVKRAGQDISLSAKEYGLLEYLFRHQGEIISRSELIEHVWDIDLDPFSNVLDVYIGYLRNKIDKVFPEEPSLIHTIKGLGYRLGEK